MFGAPRNHAEGRTSLGRHWATVETSHQICVWERSWPAEGGLEVEAAAGMQVGDAGGLVAWTVAMGAGHWEEKQQDLGMKRVKTMFLLFTVGWLVLFI